MPTTKTKIPTKRRKYHKVYAPVGGLKYDLGSTLIEENMTPKCEEVTLRVGKIAKTDGTEYFANTDTYPLDGSVMLIDQYYKLDGTEKLMCHTTSRVYYYNTVTKKFISLVDVGKNLVSRVTALVKSSKNLVCRVTRA